MEDKEDLSFLNPSIISPSSTIGIINSQPTNFDPSIPSTSKSNGDTQEKEEVYMDTLPGFNKRFTTNHVCELKKGLYGLKQSPRAWFGRFTKAMIEMEFQQN
ncbi:hypothetical protein AAG906_015908 [Vitis piasezkii]